MCRQVQCIQHLAYQGALALLSGAGLLSSVARWGRMYTVWKYYSMH